MLIDVSSHAGEAACPSRELRRPGQSRVKRWSVIVLVAILSLFLAGVLGFRIAVQTLKDRVVEALGPGSELRELNVNWSSVELIGLTIPGGRGWPSAHALHADRVQIVPAFRSLLSNRIEIASITVENPYLSVVRIPGKLLILPSLVDAARRSEKIHDGAQRSSRAVTISRIILQNGSMDIFDTTVSRPPLKIRLEQIAAVVHDVAPGSLGDRIRFELTAIARGKVRDGQIKVSGWVEAAGRHSSSHIVMNRVDMVSLQPYIVKRGDARVSKGTLDLNLKSEVRDHRLDGVGKMIIKDLEFAPSSNYLSTVMGLPRSAVINFLKDHNNTINLDFTVTGDVRHPKFSLNEALATRIATSMAEQMGVSMQGVAGGLEALGRKSLDGAGGAADAIGSVFRGLFGGGANRN
jgi:hypothetical protein